MMVAITLIFLILYFVVGSTFMLIMVALSLLGLIGSSMHRNRVESQNKEKIKVEQEQLSILKQIATKEGIELPEPPPQKETSSMKLDSFLAGFAHDYLEDEEGKAIRLWLRGKVASDIPENGEKTEKRTEYFKLEPETVNGQKNKTQGWSSGTILLTVLVLGFISLTVVVSKLNSSPELKTKAMSEALKIEEERRKAWILKKQEREKAIREAEKAQEEAQKTRQANDALITAIHRGDVQGVRKAIADGADVNAESGYATPLHRASQDSMYGGDIANGNQIRGILVAYGADVNRKASDGDTPLHSAAWGTRGGNIPAARFLIAHGADVNAKNDTGETPWHIARNFGNASFIQVLISAGATWEPE